MKKYSLDTKLAAVNSSLNGVESLRDIAKKYNVSKTMLHRWVAKYQKTWRSCFSRNDTNFTFEWLNYINETGAVPTIRLTLISRSHCDDKRFDTKKALTIL